MPTVLRQSTPTHAITPSHKLAGGRCTWVSFHSSCSFLYESIELDRYCGRRAALPIRCSGWGESGTEHVMAIVLPPLPPATHPENRSSPAAIVSLGKPLWLPHAISLESQGHRGIHTTPKSLPARHGKTLALGGLSIPPSPHLSTKPGDIEAFTQGRRAFRAHYGETLAPGETFDPFRENHDT